MFKESEVDKLEGLVMAHNEFDEILHGAFGDNFLKICGNAYAQDKVFNVTAAPDALLANATFFNTGTQKAAAEGSGHAKKMARMSEWSKDQIKKHDRIYETV